MDTISQNHQKLTLSEKSWHYSEISKKFTIKSNDRENPEKRIEATITVLRVSNPDIELSEQTFDLGTINWGNTLEIKFDISNTGDADLIIEEIV